MNELQDAEKMGRVAFAAGKPRAPALNQKFLERHVASQLIDTGSGSRLVKAYLAGLIKAYLDGWDAANSAFSIAFELKESD